MEFIMVSQSELGRQFHNGATSGKASNVEIHHLPKHGDAAVIGYDHAVYATRDVATGHTIYYSGWYGYSVSTSSQITKMRLEENADTIVDELKYLRNFQ